MVNPLQTGLTNLSLLNGDRTSAVSARRVSDQPRQQAETGSQVERRQEQDTRPPVIATSRLSANVFRVNQDESTNLPLPNQRAVQAFSQVEQQQERDSVQALFGIDLFV